MDFGLVGEVTRRLVELPDNITCIDTGFIRPQLAACYLIEEDGIAGIIETGTGNSLSTILAVLKHKQIPLEDVHYVMPTHVHLDHAGGAGHLMQHLPNAQLVIHRRGARHMIDPGKLWLGALAVYGEQAMQRMYGEHFDIPAPDDLVFVSWFEGGEVFRSGCCYQRGQGKVFYFRPGHETYPIYYQKEVLKVIGNAINWAKPVSNPPMVRGNIPEFMK